MNHRNGDRLILVEILVKHPQLTKIGRDRNAMPIVVEENAALRALVMDRTHLSTDGFHVHERWVQEVLCMQLRC